MSKHHGEYLYNYGQPGVKFGIWNSCAKEFQFGIVEDTPRLAEARLAYLIGRDSLKWRFEARRIPKALLYRDEHGELTQCYKSKCDKQMQLKARGLIE